MVYFVISCTQFHRNTTTFTSTYLTKTLKEWLAKNFPIVIQQFSVETRNAHQKLLVLTRSTEL